MEPSFVTGQRVIVSRVNYMLGDPLRGDIIVFQSPDRPGIDPPLIKRVIGLPGDTVEIRDARVFVNGQELNETYINGACVSRCNDLEEHLASDEFFVMGDNRDHSRDSRAFGPVKRESLIGEALVRYWEPQDWTLLHQFRFPENAFK
jgi:signal peptidase I